MRTLRDPPIERSPNAPTGLVLFRPDLCRGVSALTFIALVVLLFAPTASARAGDGDQDEKKQPEQTAISKFTEPFQYTDDPPFAYHFPAKKKFAKFRDRWRVVDLETRKASAIESYDKIIAEESAKESPDEQRLNELKTAKWQAESFYSRTKLLLEVDGDPNEFIRIEVVPVASLQAKIAEENPKAFIERRWKKVEIQVDREITKKSERKKNRQSHSLMLMATPENSEDRGWWRFETRLIPAKDGKSLHKLTYIHRMDASRFERSSAKDAEILAAFWLVP